MVSEFTLTVATSEDGFIGRSHAEPPWTWCSPEEQDHFFADVEAADWAIMGRLTHEAADRPDRHRIVFSGSADGWRRPTQLWLDPSTVNPADLAPLVSDVRPLNRGLILGGTRVHDWFLQHQSIDHVHLTIEPVSFGVGLPVFSDQTETSAIDVFLQRGFFRRSERVLNRQGTRYVVLSAASR